MQPVGWILIAILAPAVAGLITLLLPKRAAWPRVLVALAGPATATAILLQHATTGGIDAAGTGVIPWLPSLQINFAFLTDGLGTFFGLLVAGIGCLIVLYARGYFGGHTDAARADLYRFYPTLGFFATAMLGVVLADYTLLTLLFWEMTSISSFLLIGWDRDDRRAVRLAMQAFFTTGLGGMGLLGGLLLFGNATGVWRWSELLADTSVIDTSNGMVLAALVLLLIGACTKSAQWPFHYWLPGAMAAPTPVSAYLHSATMVKAGVFLIGRLFPLLAAVPAWPYIIAPLGAVTMLLGGVLALQQYDLKRIFAYTTVSQLGLLVCMYGLGAIHFEYHHEHLAAIDLDITQIANHAFYKAPLFIIAGALGHVLSRDLRQLGGAIKTHPAMVVTLLAAGYALAAGPGTVSFQAKELFLYAAYHAAKVQPWVWAILVMTVLTAACNVAIFVRLATTMLGLPGGLRAPEPEGHDDHHHGEHEHGWPAALIWLPAVPLVLMQYLGGLAPGVWNELFLPLERFPNYFEGVPSLLYVVTHPGIPLYGSLVGIVLGVVLGISALGRRSIRDPHDNIYGGMYWLAVIGGGTAFRRFQNGQLRFYLLSVLVALLVGVAFAGALDPRLFTAPLASLGTVGEHWPGLLMGVVVCGTSIGLPFVYERITRVLLLGACGFAVVGMYLVYRAPDLALTQLMFEIISVLLFVLVLRLLPPQVPRRKVGRWWRLPIAAASGAVMGWLTLLCATIDRPSKLGEWFAIHGYDGTALTDGRGGGGYNLVNIILVDFRGFDTYGEIVVLAIAAIGVWSMLPGRSSHRRVLERIAEAPGPPVVLAGLPPRTPLESPPLGDAGSPRRGPQAGDADRAKGDGI
jgi:multicomponent K+:H+ antiporter subunit A